LIAEVIINNNAKQLDRTFDYNIANEMQNDIKIGSRVLVPFGNMKKKVLLLILKKQQNIKQKILQKLVKKVH